MIMIMIIQQLVFNFLYSSFPIKIKQLQQQQQLVFI